MGFFNVLFGGGSSTSSAASAEALRLKGLLFAHPKITDIKLVSTPNKSAHVFEIRYLSDGLKIVGYVAFPKGFSADQKYPLIIYNHGGAGDYGKIIPKNFSLAVSAYLEHGYTVWASQYRGIGGSQGKEEYGAGDVHDVLHLLEIAQTFHFIDEYNSFMYGGSRGGMMTYLAVRHGAKVNAIANFAGVADAKTVRVNETGLERLYKNLNLDKIYRDRSAIYWPEKINVPTLLMHGDADKTVPVKQSIDLAQKMEKLGKVVELKIYRGGGHQLRFYSYDYRYDVLRWFKKYSLRGSSNFMPYTDSAVDTRVYDYATGLTKKYADPSLLGQVPYDVSTGVTKPYDLTTGLKEGYDLITSKAPKGYDHPTGNNQSYDLATGHKRPYDPITGNTRPLPTRRQKLYGMWPWK